MYSSDDSDNDDANDEVVAQALTVANAVGKASIGNTDDITIALKDLNMDNYDDEEEGVSIFLSSCNYIFFYMIIDVSTMLVILFRSWVIQFRNWWSLLSE